MEFPLGNPVGRLVVGTCSVCGGAVTQALWFQGTVIPTASCSQCGALRAGHGPMIPMAPPAFVSPYAPEDPYVPVQPWPLPTPAPQWRPWNPPFFEHGWYIEIVAPCADAAGLLRINEIRVS